MKIDLSGKIALVTGAGRGLGEAISIDLSKAGSKIIAISRNSQTLKKLKFKLKGKDNYFYNTYPKLGQSCLRNTITLAVFD